MRAGIMSTTEVGFNCATTRRFLLTSLANHSVTPSLVALRVPSAFRDTS